MLSFIRCLVFLCAINLMLLGSTVAEAAQALELRASVQKNTVELSDDIQFNISIKNTSKKKETIKELLLDVQSISLRIRYNKINTTYARYHKSPFQANALKTLDLEPGKSEMSTLTFPAVAVGIYQIYAEYNGADELLVSPVVTVTVSPKGMNDKIAVRMKTELGDFVIDLAPEVHLATVINFVGLVQNGFYDGLKIYASIKDPQRKTIMVQAGDPYNIGGSGGPGYTIPFEKTFAFHKKGTVSMLHAAQHPDTAGSQFMIVCNEKRARGFDGAVAIVGQIKDGIDVIDRISAVPVEDPNGRPPKNVKPKVDINISAASVELK